MSYRPLAVAAAVTALSVMHITNVSAQSVYVAPGGVYIGAGAGPVYVSPGVPNGAAAYIDPGYGYGYGAAAYVDPGYDYGYGTAAYVEAAYGYGYGAAAYPGCNCGYGTDVDLVTAIMDQATATMDTDQARTWRPGTVTGMGHART